MFHCKLKSVCHGNNRERNTCIGNAWENNDRTGYLFLLGFILWGLSQCWNSQTGKEEEKEVIE